ncbi:MAG: alpha-ketoacid dehydrogenase subunit beta [Proteobacteria bacterium]|nr:alpha-ketoacid dehydrogenase subunit beta [Pseudomonadota bacterium]
MSNRTLTYAHAINEALDIALASDPSVYLIGLGTPDPKGVFGSTKGLVEKFGTARVLDMPVSENALTGVVLGSAIDGMRPVLTHQRVDFSLVSFEQIINQAAKWRYMYGGNVGAPLVIRMIIGRGWGQGPQHSQSLQSVFAHIPGLKVVMPSTPADAKGLLLSAIFDDDPVVFLEHRWLYNIEGPVPEGDERVPIGQPRIVRSGNDITIAATSYMTIESLRAAELLADIGIEAEVIDLRTLNPFDHQDVVKSVKRTNHLIVADTSWRNCGIAGELVARVSEDAFSSLEQPPRRVTLPDAPVPTSRALTDGFYPHAIDIARLAGEMLGRSTSSLSAAAESAVPLDVPDNNFRGPF